MENKKLYTLLAVFIVVALIIVNPNGNFSLKHIKRNVVQFYINLGKWGSQNEFYDLSNFYYKLAWKFEPRLTGVEYNLAKNIIDKCWNQDLTPSVKKELNEALELFKTAESKDPQNINIWAKIGYTYYILGDYENAMYHYKRTIEKSPNWDSGIHKYAYMQRTINNEPTVATGDVCTNIGSFCVRDLRMKYESVNTCSNTDYDINLTDNKYCETNYWAGAKKACSDINMELANIDTYKQLYREGLTGDYRTYYWSSDEKDAGFARSFSFSDGKEYKGGYYKNFKDNIMCVSAKN